MKTVIQDPVSNKFEDLSRPKIILSNDIILISDPPFAKRIFLVFFCLCLTIYVFLSRDNYDKPLGILVCLILSIIFIYDALSLQRVKIDLQKKILNRSSLNPIENLIAFLLQHPSKIPFKNIEKIFCDYTEAFGGAKQRYLIYARTDDPYNLKIGTFNKKEDAESFATYLNRKIK